MVTVAAVVVVVVGVVVVCGVGVGVAVGDSANVRCWNRNCRRVKLCVGGVSQEFRNPALLGSSHVNVTFL